MKTSIERSKYEVSLLLVHSQELCSYLQGGGGATVPPIHDMYTSKLKKLNFRKGYRDCIKRSGDKAWMQSTRYIVTSCHGNDDKMWSTSCLIIQHKPYIVELGFMETQESTNEGPSITMEGPFQTNVVLVPLHDVTCRNHRTQFKSDIKLYTPYPCHLSHSLALLHIL